MIPIGVTFPAGAGSVDPMTFAVTAEWLGFDSIWCGEHPAVPVDYARHYPQLIDGEIPALYVDVADPWITLALAAARTERVRLGTCVCLVTERHPVLLAKELATLDRFSGGRVILGAGAGWLHEELVIMGCDPATRFSRLEESVAAMRTLWADDVAEYHGRHVDFPPVRSSPKPAGRRIPVLLGASGPTNLRRVADWADGWHPVGTDVDRFAADLVTIRRHCDEIGRDPGELDITVLIYATRRTPVRDRIEEYAEAGATRVNVAVGAEPGELPPGRVHPWGPDDASRTLEWLADAAGLPPATRP